METYFDYFGTGFWGGLQNFVIALIVLIIGWLIAKAIGSAVTKALRKINLDARFFSKFRTEDKKFDTEKIIGKVIYYILLLIVFILFFNILNLDMIANPLSGLIDTFFGFIPAVLKAGLILLLAYVIASIARWVIITGSKKINLQHFFFKMRFVKSEEEIVTITEQVGTTVFYLILLLFIPGVLDALSIAGVAQPFSGLLGTILVFVPKLLAAAIIFTVGWLVAKVIKNILVNLLQAVGSEKWIDKLKMDELFKETSLATFIGNIVFFLIMIPVAIATLEKLDLRGISEPAINMLAKILDMVPNIFIAVILILVGIWLGRFIGKFVSNLLNRIGFDRLSDKIGIGNKSMDHAKMSPSTVVGYIVQVLIVFFLAVQALYLIKLEFLVDIASAVTAYLPNVLAAILVLGVALILSGIVEKVLVNLLSGAASHILAGFAKYAIIVLAVFMALTQLGIAPTIVTSSFVLILGGLALAFGLAFGMGGKDFAHKYLEKFDRTIESTSITDYDSDHYE
ncbi:mechanosensitive ion channel [Lentibacillus sp. N15]|uniref:mechanosensitive ion channel n=1 Tax=Lentibacillus songyuanensis TaxID=3136161 RepID=UPI0031B9BAD4